MSPQNSGVPDGYSAEQVRMMLEELRTIAALEVRGGSFVHSCPQESV